MHIVPLNIARKIDRAKVATRAIFATRKSLNSQMVQNLKSPFSKPHARAPKLCGYSRQPAVETCSSLICEQPAFLNSP